MDFETLKRWPKQPPSRARGKSLSSRLAWTLVTACLLPTIVVFAVALPGFRSATLDRDCLLAAASLRLNGASSTVKPTSSPPIAGSSGDRAGAPQAGIQTDGEAIMAAVDGSFRESAHGTFLRDTIGFFEGLKAIIIDLAGGRSEDVILHCAGRVPNQALTVTLRPDAMTDALRQFTLRFWIAAGVVLAFISGCAFLLLNLTLVKPMRTLLLSMRRFRENPESTPPFDPAGIGFFADDEIGEAGAELAATQIALRTALWRQARAASLGTAMARTAHDLRGVLSPVMLIAEQLSAYSDPRLQKSGIRLTDVVERADRLISETLRFVSEVPPLPRLTPLNVAELVNEMIADNSGSARLVNAVGDKTFAVTADRDHLLRVLANLVGNASEAGARQVTVSATASLTEVAITVSDNGPGIPDEIVDKLFVPYSTTGKSGGTGLGLAISFDLMRAMNGKIEFIRTGPAGTDFRLALPRHRGGTAGDNLPMKATIRPNRKNGAIAHSD